MTKQTINLGTAPAGSDGDTTRSGFTKVNQNFDELYLRVQGKLTKDVSGGGTIALTAAEALNGLIDLTGVLTGARVVTVPAAPQQMYFVRNSTTGNFTVKFQTESGTGVSIGAGQIATVISDGANIVDPLTAVVGRFIGVKIFTSSGTYTPTPGTQRVLVEVQGAGGAGGGSAATGAGQFSGGGSGGAGGYAKQLLATGFLGASVVVGAAGVGGQGSAGGNGGSSSFGAISASGGTGGGTGGVTTSTTVGFGGAGGTATGGFISIPGGPGSNSIISAVSASTLVNGGSSVLGTGGRGVSGSAALPGGGYGGGGSGASYGPSNAAAAGGNGAPGVVIVWEYS